MLNLMSKKLNNLIEVINLRCSNTPYLNCCYVLGPTGPTGPTGPQGLPAATINVHSTTTGAPGTNASVTNSGTAENVQLDFVIPAGVTGPAPDFVIGSVETGEPGSQASVTLTPIQ